MNWQAGKYRFEFPRSTLIMGIVNVTPDSFSDGGAFFEPQRAVDHGYQLFNEGADIIDVGGESTRPKAEQVVEEEELRRVLPVIAALQTLGKPVSVDTQKVTVAREAIKEGASIINDIGANRFDPAMWELVGQSGVGYILMHMQGTPQTMQENPQYGDVTAEVGEFFAERLKRTGQAGVKAEQVVIDPGIGFGKKIEHNLQLLADLRRFRMHGRPMLLGASRKSFIGKLRSAAVRDRLPGSLACATWAVMNDVEVIRVHDVAATVQAVRMIEEIRARHQQ